MGRNERKKQFEELRKKPENIFVRSHAYEDYPERGFSLAEVKELVRSTPFRVTENNSLQAVTNSILVFVKDDEDREVKLVIQFFEMESEIDPSKQETKLRVRSAYRET